MLIQLFPPPPPSSDKAPSSLSFESHSFPSFSRNSSLISSSLVSSESAAPVRVSSSSSPSFISPPPHEAISSSSSSPPTPSSFTLEEVRTAVFEAAPKSAPGSDGIKAIFYQRTFNTIGEDLLSLFNLCWTHNHFPTPWKAGLVIPIPKKPGAPPSSPLDYRPITLLWSIAKIFERLLYNRLLFYLERFPLLFPHQFGFRYNKSTLHPLFLLTNRIFQAFENREALLVIFLDIKGAFDRAPFRLIIKQLEKLHLPLNLIEIFKSYLTDRTVSLAPPLNQYTHQILAGCPQGGILSPIFWDLAYDEMLWELHNLQLSPIAYADDTNISFQSNSSEVLQSAASKALDEIEKLAKHYNIDFNSKKTEVILFSKLQRSFQLDLKFMGETVHLSKSVKYLGIHFDDKLSWTQQINSIKTKVSKKLGIIRRVGGWEWGIKVSQRWELVEKTIFPSIFYAIPIWALAFSTQKGRNQILSALRPAFLFITSLLSSTSNDILLSLLKLPSIFHLLASYTIKQVVSHRLHLMEISHSKYTSFLFSLPTSSLLHTYFFQSNSLTTTQYFAFPPNQVPRPRIIILSREEALFNANNPSSSFSIYSDGSKSPGHVGSAFVSFRDLQIINQSAWLLPEYVTVFQAEVFAIAQGLQWISDNFVQRTKISFFVDSQSALESLEEVKSASLSHFRILNALHRLSLRNLEIVFYWCPAHSNVLGNEIADSLAKNATLSPPHFLLPAPSSSFLRKTVKEAAVAAQFKHWASLHLNTFARLFFPSFQHFSRLVSSMDQLSPFTVQILLGHHLLRVRLSYISKDVSPMCSCGESTETIHHFLFHCSKYNQCRSSIRSLSPVFPFPLSTFTASLRALILLDEFVGRTKRFSRR